VVEVRALAVDLGRERRDLPRRDRPGHLQHRAVALDRVFIRHRGVVELARLRVAVLERRDHFLEIEMPEVPLDVRILGEEVVHGPSYSVSLIALISRGMTSRTSPTIP
jgi:hypothetical protein